MIVVFGSVNLDLIFALDHLPAPGETVLGPAMRMEPGGKGTNQAVAAARDGAEIVFAGAVGRDALAEDALALMRTAGIDLSRLARVATATGCAAICVDPAGTNQIAVGSGANRMARADQIEDALLGPGTTLLLQMEVDPAETAALILRARSQGARIVLNLAPATALDAAALRSVDVLVANDEEAAWLARALDVAATAAALHRVLGVTVVVTRGSDGVEWSSEAGAGAMPCHPVTAIDTTAAGDCFCGVLAAALDRGAPLEPALRRANIAAALCCTKRGTQGSLPSAAEIEAAKEETA